MKDMRNDKAMMLNDEELEHVNGGGHYETVYTYSMDPYGHVVVHEYTIWVPV